MDTLSDPERSWRERRVPAAQSVAPQVWVLPIANPNRPIRYVFVYALIGSDGITLIDCGWDAPGTERQLVAALHDIGASLADVRTILITHAHPDHYGFARRLRDLSGARVMLGVHELTVLDIRRRDHGAHRALLAALLAAWGVPESLREPMAIGYLATWPADLAEPDDLLADDQRIDIAGWGTLDAFWTPGHSPGHLCFYSADRDVIFTGDHVLPRITPSVSAHLEQRPAALTDYLQSLLRIRPFVHAQVLPGHQYWFTGLIGRIDEINRHQHDRSAQVDRVLHDRPGISVWDVAGLLEWSTPFERLDLDSQRSAVTETYAHVLRLQQDSVEVPSVLDHDHGQ